MQRRGFTLVAAVFILMVMSLLAVTLSTFMASDSIVAVNNSRSLDAFYIASSGLEYYSRLLEDDTDWTTPPAGTNKVFSGGRFVITTSNATSNRITVTVTGLVTMGATTYSRTIQAMLVRTIGTLGGIRDDYVLYFGTDHPGTSHIANNAHIVGSFFSGGTTEVANNVSIAGNAQAAGNITFGTNKSVTGTIESHVTPPYALPTLETSSYDAQLAVAAGYSLANQTWSTTRTLSGTTYVHGNLTVNNNVHLHVTGNAKLVVTGTISFLNNVAVDDNLSLVAGGQVTMANNVDLGENGNLYSTVGFNLGNNADSGGVVTGEGTSIITPGNISFGNNVEWFGFAYAGNNFAQTGNNFYFQGNILVGGNVGVDNNATLIKKSYLVEQSELVGLGGAGGGSENYDIITWDEVY
jgi:hypothetical protein